MLLWPTPLSCKQRILAGQQDVPKLKLHQELGVWSAGGQKGSTLLMSASTRWPMVMREGMAWGLMMRSGTIPSAVQGMSS